ncbi:MAG: hypothetical protein SGJ10_00990 [Bacteroidota bacterium]|nr:hypothetical protein [Bacteroidota bacterium]
MTNLEFNGTHLEYLVGKGYQYYLFMVTNPHDVQGAKIVKVYPHKTEEEAQAKKESSETSEHDYIHSLHTAPGDIVDAASGIKGTKYYIQDLFTL